MQRRFHLRVRDVFFLTDGRTVLAGPVDEGEKAILEPGLATIWLNGEQFATVRIEPELIPSRARPLDRLDVRAVATRDPVKLTQELLDANVCVLEGNMHFSGHRHLVGIDSPPRDYVLDDMTLGPRLPEGWDGDAWMKPGGSGYFVRAWNKAESRFAVASADLYEEARQKLLEAIAKGGKRLEIVVKETQTEPA